MATFKNSQGYFYQSTECFVDKREWKAIYAVAVLVEQ